MPNMTEELNKILVPAASWAEESERKILETGVALNSAQLADAASIGVTNAERVRLLRVDRIPAPTHPILRQANQQYRLISDDTGALTVRYGIFVRSDCSGQRQLLAHELVHVMQYERFNGFREFLQAYISEILAPPGYPHGPLEREAIRIATKYV